MGSADTLQPPYQPNVAGVGGRPTVDVDIPALSVFILLYLIGAIAHQIIFQLNRRRGHKFLPSLFMFVFCMARIVTCIMRLVWATRPTNVRIAIAAQIFTNLGILIVYVVVFILSQRLLRMTHPRVGWSQALSIADIIIYVFLGIAIVLVIAFTVLSFYTLDTKLLSAASWIQRGAITYLLLFNVITLVVWLYSLSPTGTIDIPGTGSLMSKQAILGTAVVLLNLIAGFHAGTTWEPARPASDPAWYDSRAAFYMLNFFCEIVVVYMLLITRFDHRFWVPNGSTGPSDYSRGGKMDSSQEAEEGKV